MASLPAAEAVVQHAMVQPAQNVSAFNADFVIQAAEVVEGNHRRGAQWSVDVLP